MSENVTHQRTVWGVGTSRTLRAHWALAELGLAYDTEVVRTRTPDTEAPRFVSLNPRGKIPVLVDGEVSIAESGAILTYLGEQYSGGEVELLPTDVVARAHCHEWMYFVCMELDATSLYVLRRHDDLTQIYGESPVAVDAARAYFQRMIDAAVDLYDTRAPYLAGEQFSAADIIMTTCLEWAVRYGRPLPDVFHDYRARMTARPTYERALAANKVP